MNRRQLLISIPAVTAVLIPGLASAVDPQVFVLSLPFISSKGQEWQEERHLVPRARQLRDAVDDNLGHLRATVGRLRFTLLNQFGRPLGAPVTYNEVFLHGPAIGWAGAYTILEEAGLGYCNPLLDNIRSVRIEVVKSSVRIDMKTEAAERFGKVVIFADGSFAAGQLDGRHRKAMRGQIELARWDPDYKVLTSCDVTNYAEFLRGRIISMPGASDTELCEARDAVSRGGTLVWNHIKFC